MSLAMFLNSMMDGMMQGQQFKRDLVDQKLAAYLAPYKAYQGAQEALYAGKSAPVNYKSLQNNLQQAMLQLRSQYMAMPLYKQRIQSSLRDGAVGDAMKYTNPYDGEMVRNDINAQLKAAKLPEMFTGTRWQGVPNDLLGLYASGQGVPSYMADKSAQMQSDFSNRYPVKPSESYSYSSSDRQQQQTQPLSSLTWYDGGAPAAMPQPTATENSVSASPVAQKMLNPVTMFKTASKLRKAQGG